MLAENQALSLGAEGREDKLGQPCKLFDKMKYDLFHSMFVLVEINL